MIRAEIETIFDGAAAAYDQVIPFFGRFATDLVAWRGPRAGERVLDLCTGTGACLSALAGTAVPGMLVGIDLSAGMLDRARATDARLVRTDAHRLPFAGGTFDAYYCALSWHLLDQPDQVLAELRRVGTAEASLTMSLLGRSRHTWYFMGEVLREFLGTGQPANSARFQALRRRPPERVLAASGWQVTERDDTTRRFEFHDPGQWLTWQTAQLGRGYLDRVPADRQEELLARLLEEAERTLATDGLWIEQGVVLLRAEYERRSAWTP